ncbi:MAG: ABC transporter ATP-binding protein [Bacilli bacterium]|nr:ABC transporter ATP-binding protein [Bacilli bacterium]
MADENSLHGDRKMKMGEILKRSIPYLKQEIWSVIFALLLIVITVGINIILPLVTREFVDRLSSDDLASKTLFSVVGIIIGYAGLGLINQGIMYIQSMVLQKAGQRIVYRLRVEVFEHIESMSQNQFNEMPVGSLVTRVANYTAALSTLFTDTIVQLMSNLLTVFGVLAIMIAINWELSLYLLIFAAVTGVVSYIFGHIVRKFFRKERGYYSDMNTFLNENLSGMKITQIFNQQKRKEAQFDAKNKRIRDTHYKVVIAFALYRPFINLLYYGAIATTFGVGLHYIAAGTMAAGTIVAFYLYLSRFFNPIQNIADQLNNIQRATTAAERLYSLMEMQPEVVDKPEAREIDHFEGKIEFRNVWFAYEEDNWILKDVSFIVHPKETVAFVGATGAGKTTILSLIVRNFEIQKGQILIDDIDVTDIKVESLRRAVGQMLQDVFLFTGTIRNNITLHDESFTDEEINDACEYVNASSFIDKLPNKLDEEVIERGENFSAGQRQLLSFARTVLHKPQILILDEATANIDTETEKVIQDSLEKIKNIGTMLVVAHRLSTIQHCDNIIVLQGGEIMEQGNHQSLLRQKGLYYKLYKLQFEER